MKHLRNWENNTWLSSKKYIYKFSKFLSLNFNIDKKSKILDIGCGRANIISHLNKKYKFIKKPIGVDIYKNNKLKKNIIFRKMNGITFLKKSKSKFDFIIIKQTIHFFKSKHLYILLNLAKRSLSKEGKILIFLLENKNSEIPVFNKMRKKLEHSFKIDNKIIKKIKSNFKKYHLIKFTFNVHISRNQYIKMIKKKYISCLMKLSKNDIDQGVAEIKIKYQKDLKFKDILNCFVYKS
tara:strand:+ start:150 stop:860 length:711 start_codon:yes stop_codon:yes gene_type:complete